MPDQFDKYRELLGKDKVNEFLAKFGLGPNYIPKNPKTYTCPKCNKNNAIIKEILPDSDLNEISLCCPDCGYQK